MSRSGARSEAELTRMQLEAVAAWNTSRRIAEQAAASRTASREARMDVTRRMEVLRAQHVAIVESADRHLAASVHLLAKRAPSRAVVVHRNAWFAGKVRDALVAEGVLVVGMPDNGAHGVGMVVAEQPDLLVVEDTLPMVPGEQVVRDTRRFSPTTIVIGHVGHDDRIAALLDAGARVVCPRRVSPAEVAQQAVALLTESELVEV